MGLGGIAGIMLRNTFQNALNDRCHIISRTVLGAKYGRRYAIMRTTTLASPHGCASERRHRYPAGELNARRGQPSLDQRPGFHPSRASVALGRDAGFECQHAAGLPILPFDQQTAALRDGQMQARAAQARARAVVCRGARGKQPCGQARCPHRGLWMRVNHLHCPAAQCQCEGAASPRQTRADHDATGVVRG